MSVKPTSPSPPQQSIWRPSPWLGFMAMCVGMFMAILDVQVVATSLPSIQSSLGIAPDQMSWVQTTYLVAEVIAIPLTGYLTRVLSMRWLFVIAISVFTVASAGCAASENFAMLTSWRVLQGFSGGTLIPAVFSAVFVLFPPRQQGIATTIAGVLAVLAPTAGPVVGGWITEAYSWHWLFLVNVAPGVVAAIGATMGLPKALGRVSNAQSPDWVALPLLAVALASLEIGLKQAPDHGWVSPIVLSILGLAVGTGVAFIWRTLGASIPLVDLTTLKDRSFAAGCVLSFVLGIGLFGSVYLMPVFLAFVRGHNALEIGLIMLVTGAAQLITAPIAVQLETRVDPRLLTAGGFLLFGVGVGLSAFQTPTTDAAAMFWPQIIRGVAIMFCLLPPTRLALGHLAIDRVPDASSLFNLMRNLGGAVGLALIDTVIFGRAPVHAHALEARLLTGDASAAAQVGIPAGLLAQHGAAPLDQASQALLAPLIEKAAYAEAINEAWGLIAILTLLVIIVVPFAFGARSPVKDG